jgi:hypothetical protein
MGICMFAAPDKAKEAEQKKQELEQQHHEQAVAKRQERLDKHFAMQSKDVKKRMIENKKLTDGYYNQKNGNWFLNLFKKRKPYKH